MARDLPFPAAWTTENFTCDGKLYLLAKNIQRFPVVLSIKLRCHFLPHTVLCGLKPSDPPWISHRTHGTWGGGRGGNGCGSVTLSSFPWMRPSPIHPVDVLLSSLWPASTSPQRGSWLSLPSNTPALLLPITLILPIRPSLAGFSLVAGGFYFIQVSLFQNCSVCVSLCHAESLLAQCSSSMDISEWRKGPLCS